MKNERDLVEAEIKFEENKLVKVFQSIKKNSVSGVLCAARKDPRSCADVLINLTGRRHGTKLISPECGSSGRAWTLSRQLFLVGDQLAG